MAGTLDKKMSQLGSLTKKEAIQSNGALIGFAGQGNFTIKVDDLTDVYFGDLSTSWEDIARAQAAGKLVFLRFEIPGMFSTVVGPLKMGIPTLEKTNALVPTMLAQVKDSMMDELSGNNESLTSAGYEAWTEEDVDAFIAGTMNIEKVNELRDVMNEDSLDADGYAEYVRANFPHAVTMDEYIETMAENPAGSQIDVDVDVKILSKARVGIGLRYRADMPFVTPTYFAMGMPFIICVKTGGIGLENNGIGGSIFANSDVMFEVVVGLDVDFKDDGDPEGVILDLGGEVTGIVVDAEYIGDAVSASGFGTISDLGVPIDLSAILEVINDVKITVSAELTFNAVLRLLRNGWEINLIEGQMRGPSSSMPGRLGLYGLGVEFGQLKQDEEFQSAVVHSFKLCVYDSYDQAVLLSEYPSGILRKAIVITDETSYDDLWNAAVEGFGALWDGCWCDLQVTYNYCNYDAILMTWRCGEMTGQTVAIPVEIEEDVWMPQFIRLADEINPSVVINRWNLMEDVVWFYLSRKINVLDSFGYTIKDSWHVDDGQDDFM